MPWYDSIKPDILREAAAVSVPANLVAAVILRETSGNPVLWKSPKFGGRLGDSGHAAGALQVDIRTASLWFQAWIDGKYSVADGIHMGCQILSGKISEVMRLLPDVAAGPDFQLAYISAYNCGTHGVVRAYSSSKPLDVYTTKGNYGRDVLAKAGLIPESL